MKHLANCLYCARPAGFLRRTHSQRRKRHDEAAAKIPSFFPKVLHSDLDAEQFKTTLEQIAQENFIGQGELRTLVTAGTQHMIDAAYADEMLADDESRRINSVCRTFGLITNDLGYAGWRIAKSQLLRQLSEGTLPKNIQIDTGPLNLEAKEAPLWLFNDAIYYKTRTRTKYVGGSQGVSVRLMKGVYYRVGAFKSEPVRTQYLSEEGQGIFVITSRNVYFWSPRTAFKIPLKKIISVHPFSDAVQIMRDSASAVPQIFKIDDPAFACDLISRLSQI